MRYIHQGLHHFLYHKWPGYCDGHCKCGDQTDTRKAGKLAEISNEVMKEEQGYFGATSKSNYWH